MQKIKRLRPIFKVIEAEKHHDNFCANEKSTNKKLVLNDNNEIEYLSEWQKNDADEVKTYVVDMLRELAELAGQAGMNDLKLRIQNVLPGDVTAQDDLDAISQHHNRS